MNHQRTDRIRRAAILVASLDEAVAEQMLASLSPDEQALVLDEVERLDELDPQEFADVLAEFRSVARRDRTETDAVEFTYSDPHKREVAVKPAAAANSDGRAVEAGDSAAVDAEVAAIVDLLSNEQPQIIAVALSRLSHDQGSAVFAALPSWLQPEVLDRIATLQPADDAAAAEVEALLMTRMERHRQQRRQAAVGAELARRIIRRTSPEHQQTLLARIARVDAGQRSRGTSAETMPPERRDETIVAQQAQNLASAVRLSRLGERTPAYELVGEDAGPEFEQFESESLDSAVRSPAMHDDFSGDLERLSDEALLAALQQADEQLVHRALAASSEKFLKRVIGKLSRRQARSVRKQLRAMGPTRLADLRQAQFDLLQLARGRAAATAA
jgi:flagellar motor switch protein FliG